MKYHIRNVLILIIGIAIARITLFTFQYNSYLHKTISDPDYSSSFGSKGLGQYHDIDKSLEGEKLRIKELEEQLIKARENLQISQLENRKLKAHLSSTNKTGTEGDKILGNNDVPLATTEDNDGLPNTKSKLVPMCNHLPQPIPHTMALWSDHLGKIFQATKHPRDGSRFMLHDFYAEILSIMGPDRLQRSVKSIPHHWGPVQNAMNVAYHRWAYLHQTPTKNNKVPGAPNTEVAPPRKLKILVFGGSVLVGNMCRKLSFSFRIPRKECVYPYRLELFLNNLFGGDIVEVYTIALGGTNSETGHTILNYDLLDEEMRNPDIVINAYSTNDMHVLTMMDAERSGQTLRDKVLELNQKVIRVVMKPPCDGNPRQSPPIFIHMNDYLGNEQRDILGTAPLSQSIHVLANYYGFLSISSADVLRDIVYGDTREVWFSPSGWYNDAGDVEREIHPGMAMHIVSSWILAYNLLNLVTSYCSVAWAHEENMPPLSSTPSTTQFEYKAIHGLPELKGTRQNAGKPKHFPHGLPPELTKDLLLDHVSDRWRNETSAMQSCHATGPTENQTNRCIFSLVTGRFTKKMENETYVQELLSQHVTSNEGWSWNNDHDKLGFVPEKLGAEFILDFPSSMIKQSINVVTPISMKSYGERWKDSNVKITIVKRRPINEGEGDWVDVTTSDVAGSHAKNTSEIFPHEILIPSGGVNVGEDLRITMNLTAGSTFKLVGLAICS